MHGETVTYHDSWYFIHDSFVDFLQEDELNDHYWSRCGLIVAMAVVVNAHAETVQYTGMCDASAAVMLDHDKFIVANDEDNILGIYSLSSPGDPVSTVDLVDFLKPGKEADIEGAARIGNRIYWITSHGRNKKAEPKPNRRRFFATDIYQDKNGVNVKQVGTGGRGIEALFDSKNPIGRHYELQQAATRAPEADNALNIEGLAADASGGVLIGFRNPIPHGRALVVPLKNPAGFVKGGIAPKFGRAIELDLGGLGIRSFDLVPGTSRYLIVAGAAGAGRFEIFGWQPRQTPVRLNVTLPADFRPEGLMIDPDRKVIHLLSDDGDACPSQPAFRLLTLPMPSW